MELSILLIIVLSIICKTKDGNGNNKFIICSMFILFLESALRNKNTGTDLVNYLDKYVEYSNYTFEQILKIFTQENFKDPIYYFTGWLFSILFKNEQWWIVIISLLFEVSVGWLIWRESKVPLISIVIFVALSYYKFSFSGLRQTMALSIIIFSFYFLKERKLVFFILTVLLASLYHQTALIFLIAYPVSMIKLGKYHIAIAMVMLIVFYAFKNQLIMILSDLLEAERYQGYVSGKAATLTISGFIIQTLVFVFNLIYYKRTIDKYNYAIILYNLAFLGLVFQLYASFIAEMFRISMYFSIFNIILVPLSIWGEDNKKSQTILKFIILFVFLLYTFKDGITEYTFFWQ